MPDKPIAQVRLTLDGPDSVIVADESNGKLYTEVGGKRVPVLDEAGTPLAEFDFRELMHADLPYTISMGTGEDETVIVRHVPAEPKA